MHTMIQDQGSDLSHVLLNLGLSSKSDVIFPTRYSPAHPAPVETMNMLYNCGDIFLTTHLGEGWGLTITEAMAAGVPVVAPNNTCMPQQLGEDSERGYMYQCRDELWIDSSGFRKKGLIPDIISQMMKAYQDNVENPINPRAIAARKYAEQHDWKIVTKKWVELFENLKFGQPTTVIPVAEEI
jgi:glycosyltransferase involved in cell wall biosynthesis